MTRPIGDFFVSLAHLPSQSAENRRLRSRARRGADRDQRQHRPADDVDRLRELLELENSVEYPLVNSLVIGNGSSNFENVITIDRGADDGIAIDMPVVTGGDTGPRLVGRVIEVGRNASKVLLITDRDAATAARLAGTRQSGLLEGQGDADMTMSFLNRGGRGRSGRAGGDERVRGRAVSARHHDRNGVPVRRRRPGPRSRS